MRFRCVSKYWNQLIPNPSFALLRRSLHSPTQILITSWPTVRYKTTIHFVSVQVRKDANLGTPVHLLSLPLDSNYVPQSVNGLLCIHRRNIMHPAIGPGEKPVYILNPSTREIAMISVDDTLRKDDTLRNCWSHVYYYLGFSHVTGEYKVLGLRRVLTMYGRPIGLECEFYTIGSRSWRRIKSTLPFHPDKFPYKADPVCFNGALHWIRQSKKPIVAFDVGGECFREIQMPEGYPSGSFPEHLLIVGGRLALVHGNPFFDGENAMELWVSEDYQKGLWVKDCIRFPFDCAAYNCPIPVGTIHNGELVLTLVSLMSPDSLMISPMSVLCYDLKRRGFRRVEVSGLPEHCFSHFAKITSFEENIMALRGLRLGPGVRNRKILGGNINESPEIFFRL